MRSSAYRPVILSSGAFGLSTSCLGDAPGAVTLRSSQLEVLDEIININCPRNTTSTSSKFDPILDISPTIRGIACRILYSCVQIRRSEYDMF